jgi:hypothetical protein
MCLLYYARSMDQVRLAVYVSYIVRYSAKLRVCFSDCENRVASMVDTHECEPLLEKQRHWNNEAFVEILASFPIYPLQIPHGQRGTGAGVSPKTSGFFSCRCLHTNFSFLCFNPLHSTMYEVDSR